MHFSNKAVGESNSKMSNIQLIFINFFVFSTFLAIAQIGAQFPRWEERTLDCTTRPGDCSLIAPGAKVKRDPAQYKCRREPMPQTDWNKLARNSTTRQACPIGCEPEADLSVIQKRPIDNKKCQKYYTYGKYRDQHEGEWYLWLTEPCVANLTTHCRFNDIPFPSAASNPSESNAGPSGDSALQIAEAEQRRGRKARN